MTDNEKNLDTSDICGITLILIINLIFMFIYYNWAFEKPETKLEINTDKKFNISIVFEKNNGTVYRFIDPKQNTKSIQYEYVWIPNNNQILEK
jgi:high-affinity nickel permease